MKGLDNYHDHLLNQHLDPADFKRRTIIDVDGDDDIDLEENE